MIIDKMKILDHLTIQEKYLVDYIINNQEDILKKNINELAKLSYTSSATISRLCKKLGFNGYKEFKYQYAAEYSHLLELKNDFKIEPFSSESSIFCKHLQSNRKKLSISQLLLIKIERNYQKRLLRNSINNFITAFLFCNIFYLYKKRTIFRICSLFLNIFL